MSTSMRTPGVVARLSCIALAFALLGDVSFAQSSSNNAAPLSPSLLPTTTKLVAGVVTVVSGTGSGSTPGNSAAVTAGTVLACPSGLTATDKYGDGCLANEIALTAPRYAIADAQQNIFLSDYTNGLVRRIDATTGVITAVAGGATASPSAGSTTCGGTSIDARGDGCLSTKVHLSNPEGLAFATNGDLIFADSLQYDVRRVAASPAVPPATVGLVPATGGIISNIAGYAAGTATRGYSSGVVAATASYLYAPYGVATDLNGNIFIAEEGKNAIMVVNTNATGTNTVNNIAVPAGQIVKIAGAYGTSVATTPNPVCTNGTSGTYGCSFNPYVENFAANGTWLDSPYGVTVDPSGTVYIANEFNNVVPLVSTTGVLTTFAGNQNAYGANIAARGAAGSFGIGSDFGIASDPSANIYITDALNGVIWRVDSGTKAMYVVAGGVALTSVCSTGDKYGDGCPAPQSYFGNTTNTSSSGAKYATAASPGIFGVSVDTYQNLLVGDTLTNVVRQVTTGAYFGTVGAAPVTQTLTVHFAVGDGPAATNPYVITAGQASFDLGTVGTCITNSPDNTMDCPVNIISSPVTLGPFTGTLTVTSKNGATAAIALGGIFTQSPKTRLAVAFSSTQTTCAGSNTYPNTSTITLTATLTANGPNAPSGTITFFANGTQVGSPQAVTLLSSGAYGATLSNVFGLPNSYTITATYSGDTTAPIYFTGSTGTAAATLVTATPTFVASQISYAESTVKAGGTALYSFTLTPSLYVGQVNLSCTGLPANSSCSFTPAVLTTALCSAGSTVALSIQTQGGVAAQSGFGLSGSGPLARLATLFGVALALMIGLRRRKLPLQRLWMACALLLASSGLLACSSSVKPLPATPTGSYTITVTATGSAGNSANSSFTVPLVVQ